MAGSVLTLNLYGEDNELIRTCTRAFVPWKMLKKAVRLHKQIGKKSIDEFEEEDMDALTSYIMEVFSGQDLSIEILDEQSDVSEMMNVVKSVMSRARGVMDPTSPSKAS